MIQYSYPELNYSTLHAVCPSAQCQLNFEFQFTMFQIQVQICAHSCFTSQLMFSLTFTLWNYRFILLFTIQYHNELIRFPQQVKQATTSVLTLLHNSTTTISMCYNITDIHLMTLINLLVCWFTCWSSFKIKSSSSFWFHLQFKVWSNS